MTTTMTLDETLAELRLATAVRHHRHRLQAIVETLQAELDSLDLEIRATLIRVEEERPGDNYAWIVKAQAYVLIPAGSDKELI